MSEKKELFGTSAVMLTRKKPVSWSFARETRFREKKKSVDVSFVTMPSTLSPRSTVMGFGNRWTPGNDKGKDSPPPGSYVIPSTLDKKGTKFYRESSLPPITPSKLTTPGPGTYDCPSPLGREGPKYTFHGTDIKRKVSDSPAPGRYSPKTSFTEFTGFKEISFGIGERLLFRKGSIRLAGVPGPGSYNLSLMECGKTYQVQFSVRSGDLIETVGKVGLINSCPVRGFKFVYPMPGPKTLTTCLDAGEKHSHWILRGSSQLVADDSKGEFAYFQHGPTQVNRIIAKKLLVKEGDLIVFRSLELPVAEEVVLQPCSTQASRPVIPKMIHVGLIFLNAGNEAHEVYGGVFAAPNAFKVVSIKGVSKTGYFKFSRFYSKVTLLKPSQSVLPKNLYKSILPKGHFSSLPTLKSSISELVKLGKVHSIVHVAGPRGCGKRAAVFKAGWKLGYSVQEVSMCSIPTLKSLETFLADQADYSLLHIRQFNEGLSSMLFGQEDLIYKIRDIFSGYQELSRPCSLVLSSSLSAELPSSIRNQTLSVKISPPGPVDRRFLLFQALSYESSELLQTSSGKSIEEILSLKELEDQSLESVLLRFKNSSSGIPNVKWEDVGGLSTAKQEIIDTIQLPLLHPEYFKIRPRSGLLLYGPPGTGKTLLAKAIATECSLNFISVKGPELLNMYIGESEKNVRELFDRARTLQPCVLFFDELDSLAPKRGQGSDLGVMDRIVSQLLTEIDSLQSASKLFIIGATNRPDLLDAALLRPGRFDKMIYLGIPDDLESKVKVFQAQTHKFRLGFTGFEKVAEMCQGRYSGADIYAVCAQALADAYLEKVKELENKYQEFAENEIYEEVKSFEEWVEIQDLGVVVKEEHFLEACCKVKPTISEEDLEKYKYFGK